MSDTTEISGDIRELRCSVEGCERGRHAKGLCHTHYEYLRNYGSLTPRQAKAGAGLAFIAKATAYQGSGCLLWPFHKVDGYGRVQQGRNSRKAHRVVCEATHGPQPSLNHEVAHSCGMRACVNPAHLRWDTHKGNMTDCVAHGTANRGERHNHAKLTADQVRTIRSELQSGLTCTALAKEFGVSDEAVFNIRDRKTWGHLP